MTEMTIAEAMKVIENEIVCVNRDDCARIECARCDLVMPKEKVIEAFSVALEVMDKMLKDGDPNFPFAEED